MGIPRFGLLGRILVALLAVGFLPWGVASFRLMGINREAMTEQVLRTHAVAAQTTAGRVDAFLSARRVVIRSVAASPALTRDPRSPEATQLLTGLLQSPLGIVAISLRTEGGEGSAGEEVLRVQQKLWGEAAEAVLSLPADQPLAVGHGGGGSLLRLGEPLDQVAAVLWVVCDLAPLAADLQPRELGELTDLLLVDAKGALVLGSSRALEQIPETMLASALSGRVSGSGRFDAGEPMLGAFAPVEGAPWVVLSRQPAAVAEATARQLRRRSLLAMGMALLLTLGVAVIAQRSILRPLRELIQAQRRLAGPGAEEAASGGGEIAQLKSSFALLERRLREKRELDEVFLGRYQVLDVAGEGAMGTVFRGYDPALERPVALKTLRFDGGMAPARAENAARLLQEAVAVARFSHPNIVGIYDVQQAPEVAFLSMEYVDGESLADYVERRGSLPPEEAVPLALGVARGLAAAHGHGTIHRDVKPANVLLSRQGEVKIADFGISEVLSSRRAEADHIFGTPGFVPPECLRGEGYGPPGDLFALGVTVYKALTGNLPFAGTTLTEVFKATLRGEFIPLKSVLPGIPAELEALLLDLFQQDPAKRPTAEESVQRLEILAERYGETWMGVAAQGTPPSPVLTPTRPLATH